MARLTWRHIVVHVNATFIGEEKSFTLYVSWVMPKSNSDLLAGSLRWEYG